MFCANCGNQLPEGVTFCSKCGAPVAAVKAAPARGEEAVSPKSRLAISEKSRLVALLLCWFLGCLGIHRFYVGKIGTGILWLLTIGILGIGALVDFIMIAIGNFKDKDGKVIRDWGIK